MRSASVVCLPVALAAIGYSLFDSLVDGLFRPRPLVADTPGGDPFIGPAMPLLIAFVAAAMGLVFALGSLAAAMWRRRRRRSP